VTRRIVIAGLILLAAFLPLAALPVAVFVLEPRVFVVDVAQFVGTDAPTVTLLALVLFRAPPSR